VLSRAKVRVHRLPAWREVIRLSTWPKGLDGVLFRRDFRLTDTGGVPLVDGTTGWLLLDFAAHKPHLMDALPTTMPPNLRGHAMDEPLRKLRPFPGLRPVYEHRVVTSDTDINLHVNNARYVEWIMDCYTPEETARRSVRTLQVNYVSETTFGTVIRLDRAEDPSGGGDYIEGTNNETGEKVVQAVLEWKDEDRAGGANGKTELTGR
jgi:acyl-ACP thioesterase